MPGVTLGICLDLCSDSDIDQMVVDLKKYTAVISTIKNPYLPKYAICNTVGEACVDWRLRGGATTAGPYENEKIFQ